MVSDIVRNGPVINNAANAASLARVKQLGVVIEGNSATVAEKLDAYNAVRQLTGWGNLYRAGARDANIESSRLLGDTDFGKHLMSLGNKYNDPLNEIAFKHRDNQNLPQPNWAKLHLDRINSFSPDDQMLIAENFRFGDLATYKENLQKKSDEFERAAPNQAVRVTLSDEAKATIASAGAPDAQPKTAAEQALAALIAKSSADANNAAALEVLESAAQFREALQADAQANASRQSTADVMSSPGSVAYTAADSVDTSV